jgi:hypothetical protein
VSAPRGLRLAPFYVQLASIPSFFHTARVRWVRNVCSVLLAVFWLGASSHPLLESAGLIHHHDSDGHSAPTPAHPDDGDADHDAADGKCPVTHARVSIPHPPTLEFALAVFACSDLFNRIDVEIDSSGLAPPLDAPIPISSWQFSLRTALAPRAPSSLS